MRTDHNVNEREKNVFIEVVQFCKKYVKNEKVVAKVQNMCYYIEKWTKHIGSNDKYHKNCDCKNMFVRMK